MAEPTPSGPEEVGKKICEALGLPPDLVRSIRIDMEVNDLVTITVERYARKDELTTVVEVFDAIEWKKQEKREG